MNISFDIEPEFIYSDNNLGKSKLKILAIGDPHFKLSNSATIQTFISRVVALIEQIHPDFVVVMGDLLDEHERVHTTILNHAYNFIHKIRKLAPVYVLVGNHDFINNRQFRTSNHWMNAMKEWDNVKIVDEGISLDTDSGKIIFAPYVAPGRFIECLELIDNNWKSARAIFCHQEFRGCKMGAITSIEGDEYDSKYPFIVSGHIHDKQRIQPNIFYLGSSIQHAFGESTDKTVSICCLEENIGIDKVNLGLGTKRIIYSSIDEISDFDKYPSGQDQLRITLSGSTEEFKVFKKTRKYKEMVQRGIKIVYSANKYVEDKSEENSRKSFELILSELIASHSNKRVYEMFRQLQ